MLITTTEYFLLFLFAFGIVAVLTPVMRKIAISKKILDLPVSSHKSHKVAVPYLGGIAILIGVIVVSYLALFFSDLTVSNFLLATSVLAPAVAMGLVGLWDDMRNLPPLPRFIAQSLSGIVVALVLIVTDNVANPTGSTFIDAILTLCWVVGICNSINFFDNLDGGAAGTTAISVMFLACIAIAGEQSFVAALSIVVAGATLGFLIWNKAPARIYMGDAGALFLGVLVASLTIRLNPTTETSIGSFATPILLLAIPILDTSVAIISRLKRRISPFVGGTDHLSHRLLRMGLQRKSTAILLWSFSAFFGLVALIINLRFNDYEIFIVIVTLILWIIMLLFFLRTLDNSDR